MVGDGVVLAANAPAAAAGVVAGMRRRQAETLCPAVVTLAADPGAEAAAFEALAAAVEGLVPRVEVAAPGLLFVPVAGAVGYYGGEGPLVARVAAGVAEAGGPEALFGLADGPFAARLAAAAASDGPVIVADTRAFLAGLDVSVLGMEEMAATLRWLGVTTLGALGALPREALASRGEALFNSGSSRTGNGYVCQDTAEGRVCTCMGQMDCLRMFENVCTGGLDDPNYGCQGEGSEEVCTCTGKPWSRTDGIGTSPTLPGRQNVLAP